MENYTTEKKKLYYRDFKKLLDILDFKIPYLRRANITFKKNGTRLGIWKIHKNGKYGIIDYRNCWCWRNTINTHVYAFHDMYYLLYDMTGILLDFTNKSKWEESINILWEFVDKNFDLFFTENVESKYFNKFRLRTNKSWTNGQLGLIGVLYKLREHFSDCVITSISFKLERGDADDFKGKDIVFKNSCGEKIAVQVKMGKIVNQTNEGYEIECSSNDLNADCNYYSFIDIDIDNNVTTIVSFQKIRSYMNRLPNGNVFYKKEIMNKITKEDMQVTQILTSIAQYCYKNTIVIDLKYENGESNKIIWNNKPENIVDITIGDFKDKDLPKYLSESFTELKKFFH